MHIKLDQVSHGIRLPAAWTHYDKVGNWHNLPQEFTTNFINPTGRILAWKIIRDDRPWIVNSILYFLSDLVRPDSPRYGLLVISNTSDAKNTWYVNEIEICLGPYIYTCESYASVPTDEQILQFCEGNYDADFKVVDCELLVDAWVLSFGRLPFNGFDHDKY